MRCQYVSLKLSSQKRNLSMNKKTFSYFEGILNNWKSCGYKTLQEIKDNDIKPNKTGTVIPKWFDKDNKSKEASEQEQQEMANILSGF